MSNRIVERVNPIISVGPPGPPGPEGPQGPPGESAFPAGTGIIVVATWTG